MKNPPHRRLCFTTLGFAFLLVSGLNPLSRAFADPGNGGGVPALRDSITTALQELREIKALVISQMKDPRATATVCFDLGGEIKVAGEAIADGRMKVEGFAGVDIYGTGLKLKPDIGGQVRGVIGAGGKVGVSAKVCVDVPLPCLDEPRQLFVNALTEGGVEVCGRLPEVAERLGWSPGVLQAKLSEALSQLENAELPMQPGYAMTSIHETLPNLVSTLPMGENVRASLAHLPAPPTSVQELNPLSNDFMFDLPPQVDQIVTEIRDRANIGDRLRSTIETVGDITCNICEVVDCNVASCNTTSAPGLDTGRIDAASPIELTPIKRGAPVAPQDDARFGLFNPENPARPGARIRFALSSQAPVDLTIFSINGSPVRQLAGGDLGAGTYQVAWDGYDDSGAPLPDGVYFVRLVASTRVDTKKIVLMN